MQFLEGSTIKSCGNGVGHGCKQASTDFIQRESQPRREVFLSYLMFDFLHFYFLFLHDLNLPVKSANREASVNS